MLDTIPVRAKYLEWVIGIAIEVIFERFTANSAADGSVAILAFKHRNIPDRVITRVFVREDQCSVIDHSEYSKNTCDRRQLDVFLAVFETRDCRRADASQFTKTLLRQPLTFSPLLRLFDDSWPVDAKLPFHLLSILSCKLAFNDFEPTDDFSIAIKAYGKRVSS